MKIEKALVAFLLFLTTFKTLAQEEPNRPDINNSYITFDTFAAFAFVSPRYTFGYIMPIHRRWMVGMEIGYGHKDIISGYYNKSLVIGNDYQLFEVRPKVYYKLKPSSKFQPYLSAEFFYINHQDHYENSNDYLKRNRYINLGDNIPGVGGGSLSYDSADYMRQKAGFNFNIGLLLTLVDNFGVNLDAGLGFRNRNISYKNVENQMLFSPEENENFVTSPATYAIGNEGGANLSINIKLFYKFDKGADVFKKNQQ